MDSPSVLDKHLPAFDADSKVTSTEKKWSNMAADDELPEKEKLIALLEDEVLWEKRYERKYDVEGDHPLALFSRLKKQSRRTIFLALFLITLVHFIQIGAMYNLTTLSFYIATSDIAIMLERGDWISTNPQVTAAMSDMSTFPDKIHGMFNTTEVYLPGKMREYGFCLSESGYLETMFNVTSGLFLVFMFVFQDLWRVIFATRITRNFPTDENFKLMLVGIVWIILLNSIILAWLGVESGRSVVASAGEFSAVLFNSMANFLILSLDDQALPLLRFILEESGEMNQEGWMNRKQLDSLTHGAHYYKPGYGVNWVKTITSGPSKLVRFIALVNIPIALSIAAVPLGISIYDITISYVRCAN